MRTLAPNHALPFRQAQGPEFAELQRTQPSRSGCNHGVPRAGSLSLSRYAKK